MSARRKARAIEAQRLRAAGAEAFRRGRGRGRQTCPYASCSSDRGQWLGGYCDAEAAARRQGLTP